MDNDPAEYLEHYQRSLTPHLDPAVFSPFAPPTGRRDRHAMKPSKSGTTVRTSRRKQSGPLRRKVWPLSVQIKICWYTLVMIRSTRRRLSKPLQKTRQLSLYTTQTLATR